MQLQTAFPATGLGGQLAELHDSLLMELGRARTLQPSSGGGTDHAWGGHHIVAVKNLGFLG